MLCPWESVPGVTLKHLVGGRRGLSRALLPQLYIVPVALEPWPVFRGLVPTCAPGAEGCGCGRPSAQRGRPCCEPHCSPVTQPGCDHVRGTRHGAHPPTTPSSVGLSRRFNRGESAHSTPVRGWQRKWPAWCSPTHVTLQGAEEEDELLAALALSSGQEGTGVFGLALGAWEENTEKVLGQL